MRRCARSSLLAARLGQFDRGNISDAIRPLHISNALHVPLMVQDGRAPPQPRQLDLDHSDDEPVAAMGKPDVESDAELGIEDMKVYTVGLEI